MQFAEKTHVYPGNGIEFAFAQFEKQRPVQKSLPRPD